MSKKPQWAIIVAMDKTCDTLGISWDKLPNTHTNTHLLGIILLSYTWYLVKRERS